MQYLIVGGSAAGILAIEAIRSHDKEGKIILVSDETESLYSRCLLSYYLAGAISQEKLKFRLADFFAKNKVETLLGEKVEKILPKDKEIILSSGKKVNYDTVLIATGSRAKKLGLPNEDLTGVFNLRNFNDAQGILSLLNKTTTVVVLGGGLIGLRAAYALHKQGKNIKIVVKSKEILSRALGEEPAKIIRKHIESQGIEVITGCEAKQILGKGRGIGKEEVEGIILDNGSKLDCQIIIVGKGVTPNKELLAGSGVEVDEGILTGDNLATNIKDIYSAGDVAETKDLITGKRTIKAIWPCAIEQGRIAGLNMVGEKVEYAGALGMNSVEFFGLSAISVGQTQIPGGGKELIRKFGKVYKRLIFKDSCLVGATLIGKIENAGVYGSLIRAKVNLSGWEERLMSDNFNFARIVPLIRENASVFNKPEYQEFCGAELKRKI